MLTIYGFTSVNSSNLTRTAGSEGAAVLTGDPRHLPPDT